MIYAAYTTPEGVKKQGLFDPSDLIMETFSPETDIEFLTDFRAKSKEEARELAKSIQQADCKVVNAGGNMLSYGEIADIYAQLEKLARQFGLVREFKGNGII